jgi:hypothetical protein
MTERLDSGHSQRFARRFVAAGLNTAICLLALIMLVPLLPAVAAPVAGLPVEATGGTGLGLMHWQRQDSVVIQWNDACLQAIRVTRPGPPVVARALAMVHTAIYDAWAAYDRRALGTRFGAALRRPVDEVTKANKMKAISFAAYRVLVDLFPSEQAGFDALMASQGYDPFDLSTDRNTPSGIGNVVASAILAFRHDDGSNQLGGYADTTGYEPVNTPDAILDPDRWQPLRIPDGSGGFTVQKFAQPHWQDVIPFALRSAAQFRPPPPQLLPEDEAGYGRQARQLIRISARLTDRMKAISEYWADGPSSEQPPGHWTLFAEFVSRRDGHSLGQDVRLFFALSNAVFDAGIACWEAKRTYDYVRPVTAIHYLFAGRRILAWGGPYQGTRLILGEEWQPYRAPTFGTPPFPEYVSGHSTFSAAAAEVLKRFTGSDRFGGKVTIPAGSSLVEPGAVPATDVTLRWSTFSAAADQAGLSRRYGGIHFPQGDLEGRELGRAVGSLVWTKARRYFNRDDHDRHVIEHDD